jgi:regulation of enolase protein 1 (concanavalin A-like superfamily)
VTRELSDDANGEVLEQPHAYLRISRLGQAFAFHTSQNGSHWQLFRHFGLDIGTDSVRLGLLVQSPTGDGCQTTFDDVRLEPTRLADLRSGV